MKFNHATHGLTKNFTLTIIFKNRYEEIKEGNELSNQTYEIEQGERCYISDSETKLTKIFFRYHDIRVYFYCKLPKAFCSSKFVVNIKKQWSLLFLVVDFDSKI